MADARLRVSRAGGDAAAADGRAGGGGDRGGGAGAVLPVAAAVQPADPQAGAVDAGGVGGGRPRAASEGYESLAFLVGETGRTTSPLRPTGKARFGSLSIDVSSAGGYIEADSLVEVLDVQGPRVIVKKV